MPLICAATISWLRYGSSPVVVRLRPQLGRRSRSVCGPNMPVTMNARDSVPSVWPQALPRPRSKVEPSAIRVVGPVDPRAFGPEVFRTPWASVQQIGAIDGFVPLGALTGPTLWHAPLGPSCRSLLALAISARVGGLSGSSWWIRSSTTGVYGAAASTAGDVFAAGRTTGNWYGGTSAEAAPGQATAAASATVAAPRQPR